jgi:hypothetical protein
VPQATSYDSNELIHTIHLPTMPATDHNHNSTHEHTFFFHRENLATTSGRFSDSIDIQTRGAIPRGHRAKLDNILDYCCYLRSGSLGNAEQRTDCPNTVATLCSSCLHSLLIKPIIRNLPLSNTPHKFKLLYWKNHPFLLDLLTLHLGSFCSCLGFFLLALVCPVRIQIFI